MIDDQALKDALEKTINEWFFREQSKVHICDGAEDGSVGAAVDELVDVCHTQMVAMIRGNTRSLELSVGEVLQLKALLDRVNTPSFKDVQDRLESMEVPDDIE